MDSSLMSYLIIAVLSQILIAVFILKDDFLKKGEEKYIWFFFIITASILLMKFIFLIFEESVLTQSYSPSLSLALPPLLYMYIQSARENQHIPRKNQLWHFIPTIVLSCAFIIVGFKIALNHTTTWLSSYKKIYDIVYLLINLSYYSYILFTLIGDRKRNEKMLSWIIVPTILFLCGLIFLMLKKWFLVPVPIEWFLVMSLLGTVIFVGGYLQNKFLKGKTISAQLESNQSSESKTPKYEKSSIKTGQADDILASLEEYMTKEKPFLNADLSLSDIADGLNIPKHYITEVLNLHLKKNFFLFVNEYRVDEAKRKMQEEEDEKLFMIAHYSGFNSKTTFIKYFKEIVGVSPSEYRRKLPAIDS